MPSNSDLWQVSRRSRSTIPTMSFRSRHGSPARTAGRPRRRSSRVRKAGICWTGDVLLVLLKPCKTLRLTGQERGRAIPLADVAI